MEELSSMEIPSIFVNREDELQEITQTVDELQDKQRLLKTPIIEYSGVQGIGKSTLLQQIEHLCSKRSVTCISGEARHITSQHFQRAESLAEKEEPVVVIVDALDELSSESQPFRDIESSLSKLLENNKGRVLVVLASRGEQKFERTRSIKRKLKIRHLKPLEQEHCRQYLSHFAQAIPPDAWDNIFDWTLGYPLALKTMTWAIRNKGLNPTQSDSQKQLIAILMQEVIANTLLVKAPSPEDRTRLQRLLTVLSIARRFNITLAQDLIEHFAPQYKLGSSFAYITLPQIVNEVTSVLTYKLELVGYCIDAPIRNLFLLYSRIMNPGEYKKMHIFLAEQNKGFIQAVSGSDRVRYLREFFYHLACYEEDAVIQENLTHYITQLAQVQGHDERALVQSLESFLLFYVEFQHDEELKETLKQEHTRFVLWLWYRNFIEIYRQIPENMREGWLKQFFSFATNQPEKDDFSLMFEEGMRHIIMQVSRNEAIKLYNELIQDEQVIALLGEQLGSVKAHAINTLLDEGQ